MKTTYDENTGILTAQYPPGTTLKRGTTFGFQIDYDTIKITPLIRPDGWYVAKGGKTDIEIIEIVDGEIYRTGYSITFDQSVFHYISPTPLNLEELAKGGGV